MPKPYQPTWARDHEEGAHQRACADRYETISREVFERFWRPFSVFDLGANMGYFALRAAWEWDAVPILVDRQERLAGIIARNGAQAVWLDRHLTGDELLSLSRSERFDVVLALNILHHIEDWGAALRGLRDMARYLIIEIPGPGERRAKNPEWHEGITEAVATLQPRKIGEFPSHVDRVMRPLYLVDTGEQGAITEQSIDARKRQAPRCRATVTQTDDRAEITIEHETGRETRRYLPGMNLWNWRLLGGRMPDAGWVRAELERLAAGPHDDPMPWNFVMDGTVRSIDHNNKPRKRRGARECLRTWDSEY